MQEDPSRLLLSHLQVCIKYMGFDMDLSEVECIMSVLIYKGYIKGYISHAKKTAVLSKQNAFPPVSKQYLND